MLKINIYMNNQTFYIINHPRNNNKKIIHMLNKSKQKLFHQCCLIKKEKLIHKFQKNIKYLNFLISLFHLDRYYNKIQVTILIFKNVTLKL